MRCGFIMNERRRGGYNTKGTREKIHKNTSEKRG